MKKIVLRVTGVIVAVLLLLAVAFVGIYYTRFSTIATVKKLTSYDDGYDMYRVDIKYAYDIDDIINYGITDDQSMSNAIIKEVFPLLPIKLKLPSFGCSAFMLEDVDGDIYMGRSYDFRYNTSAMLVYCTPKDGYSSVAFAALDNLAANTPTDSFKQKLNTLATPFVCLDGMNEKGVSIAVLTLDSEPVHQESDKPTIFTTLAVRLVLDRAATTAEAVELLNSYDMHASSNRDYHFYINDASGDARVVEYDCESETRELVATPVNAVTNFFTIYEDKVLPNQKNGIYGHGKERYDDILAVMEEEKGNYTINTAWNALMRVAQLPSAEKLTSNTQWSIVYNNTDVTAEIVLRRHWTDVFRYSLSDNKLTPPTSD